MRISILLTLALLMTIVTPAFAAGPVPTPATSGWSGGILIVAGMDVHFQTIEGKIRYIVCYPNIRGGYDCFVKDQATSLVIQHRFVPQNGFVEETVESPRLEWRQNGVMVSSVNKRHIANHIPPIR